MTLCAMSTNVYIYFIYFYILVWVQYYVCDCGSVATHLTYIARSAVTLVGVLERIRRVGLVGTLVDVQRH